MSVAIDADGTVHVETWSGDGATRDGRWWIRAQPHAGDGRGNVTLVYVERPHRERAPDAHVTTPGES